MHESSNPLQQNLMKDWLILPFDKFKIIVDLLISKIYQCQLNLENSNEVLEYLKMIEIVLNNRNKIFMKFISESTIMDSFEEKHSKIIITISSENLTNEIKGDNTYYSYLVKLLLRILQFNTDRLIESNSNG